LGGAADQAAGHSRNPVSQDPCPAADRQAEAISSSELDCHPCARTGNAEKQKEDRLEASDRFAGPIAQRCYREARVVRNAVEDRALPQDPKSCCKAEESRLRTAERLANLISLFCILSWRIFWMTMLNRCAPVAPPNAALTATEIELLREG
jgi:hypothetical protein